MRDATLMQDLKKKDWPTDESTCEKIGVKNGLGAEQVAAVSKYQQALLAEKEEETLH
jgi:hypothetical protein